jgi:signal transduction histidine kinase
VVHVVDTGTGIAPADLPHIFEPGYRADAARGRRSATGDTARTGCEAGLGLTIATRLVEAHGGRLWATSPLPPDIRVLVPPADHPPERRAAPPAESLEASESARGDALDAALPGTMLSFTLPAALPISADTFADVSHPRANLRKVGPASDV